MRPQRVHRVHEPAVGECIGDEQMAEFVGNPRIRHRHPRQKGHANQDRREERQGYTEGAPVRQPRPGPLHAPEPGVPEKPETEGAEHDEADLDVTEIEHHTPEGKKQEDQHRGRGGHSGVFPNGWGPRGRPPGARREKRRGMRRRMRRKVHTVEVHRFSVVAPMRSV